MFRRVKLGVYALLVGGLVSGPAAADTGGDATRGEELYPRRCGACHAIDRSRVGPRHRGLFGRKAGSVPGYRYSRAVKQSQIVWTAESLDRWLADPEALIPGQKMGYRLTNPDDRRDIIAYLKTLNDR